MNFIEIWLLGVVGVIGTIIGAVVNTLPILMIKEGLKASNLGATLPGIVLGLVVYSLELALILQFLYGK